MKKILAMLLSLIMVLSAGLLYLDDIIDVKAATTTTTDTSKEMLDVKVQVSSDQTMMRFISSVDSLNYSSVGFEVTPEGEETKPPYETTTVYERIASTTEGVEYSFSPKVVDTTSEYFVTAKMNVEAGKDYTVRAYVVSLDGETKTYGMSRCVAVEDAVEDNSLRLSFASTASIAKDTELSVVYGAKNNETMAKVIGSDGNTVYVDVTVDEASLPSATLFTFSGAAEGSTIYRNLYTSYADGADTTWYDVYKNTDTEFVLATDADLYGLAITVSKSDTFKNKTIYVVSDIAANEGAPVLQSDNSIKWYNDAGTEVALNTLKPWTSIGGNADAAGFAGTFDGQGHTISGIYFEGSQNSVGMFGRTQLNSMVKNFKLVNSYISNQNYNTGGIIGKCWGNVDSVYSNMIVKNTYTGSTAYHTIGGIVGNLDPYHNSSVVLTATANNCWFEGTVISTRPNTGGIVGTASMYRGAAVGSHIVNVTNCLVTGTVQGSNTGIGGIVGYNSQKNLITNVENCLMSGALSVSETSGVGTIIGSWQTEGQLTIKDTYTTQDATTVGTTSNNISDGSMYIAASDITGDKAYTYASEEVYVVREGLELSGEGTLWTATENGTPELIQFSEAPIDVAWYYDDADAAGGEGDDVFTISTADEMYGFSLISQTYNFTGKEVQLTANITLNEGNAQNWKDGHISGIREWTPIATSTLFSGTFDGQGKTISGLYASGAGYVGLFAMTASGSVVKNFRLTNSCFKGQYFVASVAGVVGGEINTVYSTAYVVAEDEVSGNANKGRQSGGIAGVPRDNGAVIQNCWFAGVLDGDTYLGGILGDTNGKTGLKIRDCLFSGIVHSDMATTSHDLRIGGLVGRIYGTGGTMTQITNCLSIGDVDVQNATSGVVYYVGSVIGLYSHAITYSNVYGWTKYVEPTIGDKTNGTIANVNAVSESSIIGDNAESTLSSFDWEKTWTTVDESTPILKIFITE